MKKITLLIASFFLLHSCASVPNYKYLEMADLNPATQYLHFETEHFEFTYQKDYLSFTKEAAKHFEHAHVILSPILKWKPKNKIQVLIADNSDSANGFAMPALRVGIVLIATPPDQWFSTSYSDNWIKLLVFHEYVHILNIDPTTEWMETLRVVFGDSIRPNGLWPTWMLEGLAVYLETKTSILGRGRSPYYDAIIRSYFNEGKLSTNHDQAINYGSLSGNRPYFPGGETSYLFGYHLWNQFGKQTEFDSKAGEYSINSSHRFPWFIDGNLENVTGKTWGDYWNDFVSDSNTRYKNQIEKIKSMGETSYSKVTDSKFSATGGVISPDGQWFAYTETKLDERQGLTLENFRTGKIVKIKDKVQGATMSFTPDSKKLIFSSLGRDTTFTEFSDLWVYDLSRKQFSQLTKGMRAKDPHISPDGKMITFITTDHATQVLKVADLEYDKSETKISDILTVYQPKEFSMIGTPHWINNSEIVFSLQEINQSESNIIQIAATPLAKPVVVVQNGKMNRFPFSCNGELYYISDQSGIDNVYSTTKAITNVVTAVQFPFCSLNRELYASLLTSNGFEIVRFAPTPTTLTSSETVAVADAPKSIPAALISPEIKISSITDYQPWRMMAPRAWSPLAYFQYSSVSGASFAGLLAGFDTSGKHQYFGSLGYNTKSKTIDQSLQYTYYGFRPAITISEESFTSDVADDLFGDHYKRTHQLRLQLDHLIRWTWSSMRITPYGLIDWNSYNSLVTQEREISSDLEFNHPYIPVAGISVSFNDTIQSKLGFISEGGSRITAATQARTYQDEFTLWKFMSEYSRYIGLGSHHVLNPKVRYLGSSHPYGIDRSYALLKGRDTNDSFDNGTGFSLNRMQIRGYSDWTIKTKSSFQGGLDYHFPIDTFFSGSGPLFLGQAHGFIFAETTYIPSTRFKNLFLPAFGAGLTADLELFWHAPLSVSFEMQYGTKKDFGGDQTFFLSFAGSIF